MSAKKKTSKKDMEKYYIAWSEIIGSHKLSEEEFWKLVKTEIKSNWSVFRLWTDLKLFHTLHVLSSKYNVDDVRLKQFTNDFYDLDSLPSSIKLINHIINKIKNAKAGQVISLPGMKSLKKKKVKRQKKVETPLSILRKYDKVPYWIEEHPELYKSHVTWTVQAIIQEMCARNKLDSNLFNAKLKTKLQRDVLKELKSDKLKIENIEQMEKRFLPSKFKTTLHQKYIGLKTKDVGSFMDFGDTGVGKTVSGLTAVAHGGYKTVVVTCPANIVLQWKGEIMRFFPGANVLDHSDILNETIALTKSNKRVNFIVLSYSQISRHGKSIFKNILSEFKSSLFIADEGQRLKQRNMNISKVRQNCKAFIEMSRKGKKKLDVLLLTATPVINSVSECKAILEMVSTKTFPHITTSNSYQNLGHLHAEIAKFSIRHRGLIKKKDIKYKVIEKDVECRSLVRLSPVEKEVREIGYLAMDLITLDKKQPRIIEEIKKLPKTEKVILHTKFVAGIIPKIHTALNEAGISTTTYTGSDKRGILASQGAEFFNDNVQVLVASSAISEGLDKLQHICRNIWFVGHGWTYAEKKQTVGRVARKGQTRNVKVINFVGIVNGVNYDELVHLNRVSRKKDYHDAVLDGIIPEEIQLPKKESWNKVFDRIIAGENLYPKLNPKLKEMKALRKKQRKASKYDIPQETNSVLKRKYKMRKKKGGKK